MNRYYELYLTHLTKGPTNQTNKKTIANFVKQLVADNLYIERQSKYIYTAIKISEEVGQ